MAAELPPKETQPDVLIVEATYGMQARTGRSVLASVLPPCDGIGRQRGDVARELCSTLLHPPFNFHLFPALQLQVHESKDEREARFCESVARVVLRGGRCLLPVFALGRAQELLLILDEMWAGEQGDAHAVGRGCYE